MKRVILAGALPLAAALTLIGCGSTAVSGTASGPTTTRPTTPTLPPVTSSTPSAPATTTGPSLSSRGTLVKALGEKGGVGDDIDHLIQTFTIDSIAPVKCDAPYRSANDKPNGTLVGAHFRWTNAPGADLSQGITYVNPADFSFVGADGVTHAGQEIADIATYGCLKDAEKFPQVQLAPGSSYVGTIVFDLPETHGALIYSPGTTNASGWEWDF